MAQLARDTSDDAERVMVEIYRRMPASRRLRILDDACRAAIELALAGLRSRHPGASEAELDRRLKGLLLGEDLAATVYDSRR